MTVPESPRPRIDGARLARWSAGLSSIGRTESGGVTRLAFSAEDVEGRAYVAGLMAEADLDVTVDAGGNLIGRRPGRRPSAPALVIGSHIDTVVDGGAYDGAFGVLAGIEVAMTLRESGMELDHPLVVIAFCDEEGAYGTMGMLGSHAFAGALPPEVSATLDDRGRSIGELVASVGGDLAVLARSAWQPGSVAAYFEAHIEQGDVLERLGVPIGVVETIIGRMNVTLTVEGRAGHAGTTSMEHRADALVAAAQLILAIRKISTDERVVLRSTVGTCALSPDMWNVIPGEVTLGAEFRDADAACLDKAVARLTEVAEDVARGTNTLIKVSPGARTTPVACDPRLRRLIATAAEAHGLLHHSMPSGAGHDAQIVARIAPVGMIFVPSRGGVSHAPGEYTAPEQLAAGADVLLTAVLMRDAQM